MHLGKGLGESMCSKVDITDVCAKNTAVAMYNALVEFEDKERGETRNYTPIT